MTLTPVNTYPVLDESKIMELSEDKDLLEDIITLFFREVPALLGKIQNSLKLVDPSLLKQTVHNLKGMALNLGTDQLAYQCKVFEDQIISGKKEDWETSLSSLIEIYGHTKTAMEYWLNYSRESGDTGLIKAVAV